MKSTGRVFVNELGKRVSVGATLTEADITIRTEGPDSEHTNTLTLMEGRELTEVLLEMYPEILNRAVSRAMQDEEEE